MGTDFIILAVLLVCAGAIVWVVRRKRTHPLSQNKSHSITDRLEPVSPFSQRSASPAQFTGTVPTAVLQEHEPTTSTRPQPQRPAPHVAEPEKVNASVSESQALAVSREDVAQLITGPEAAALTQPSPATHPEPPKDSTPAPQYLGHWNQELTAPPTALVPIAALADIPSETQVKFCDDKASAPTPEKAELSQHNESGAASYGIPPAPELNCLQSLASPARAELRIVESFEAIPPVVAPSIQPFVESQPGTFAQCADGESLEIPLPPAPTPATSSAQQDTLQTQTVIPESSRRLEPERFTHQETAHPLTQADTSIPSEVNRPNDGETIIPAAELEEGTSPEPPAQEEEGHAAPKLPTAPGQYQPPRLAKPVAPSNETKKPKSTGQKIKVVRQQLLEIHLQALFDHYQYCTLRLLAARPKNSQPEVAVDCAGTAMELIESSDEMYEIAEQPSLGPLLVNGVLMVAQNRAATQTIWELKGRPLYILAANHGLAGFVTTTRLVIGRDQVVLCREEMASEVQTILGTSGCADTIHYGHESGAPEGWVFFKPVKPVKSVQPIPGEEMHNLLRPLPDIELALEGGIWLENSTWMAGFPPQILVFGELPGHASVQIDGRPAEKQRDGTYQAPAFDTPGRHSVFCEGKTCSYSIIEPTPDWETWDPLSFGSTSICGAEVKAKVPEGWHYTKAPTTNPILIGADPGEVFRCEPRPAGVWSGYVPFKAIWALPEDAAHCKRDICRMLLIAPTPPIINSLPQPIRATHKSQILRWCRIILECKRKRLPTDPANQVTAQLWTLYTTQARHLARKLRHHDP